MHPVSVVGDFTTSASASKPEQLMCAYMHVHMTLYVHVHHVAS